MEEFSYLAVLLSIVLGLGMARLLTGLGSLIEARARVRIYGPSLVWTLALLLIHVQTWWSMFGLRNHEPWTFVAFLVVLLQPVVLFLLTVLVLPAVPPERSVDLQEHYHEQATWFFSLCGALPVVSLVKDIVLEGALPSGLNVAFHLAFGALAAVGAVSAREVVHRALAGLSVVLLSVYVAVLFAQLH